MGITLALNSEPDIPNEVIIEDSEEFESDINE